MLSTCLSNVARFGLLVFVVSLVAPQAGCADSERRPLELSSEGDGKALEPKAIAKLGRSATAYVEVELPGKRLTSGSAFCVHPSGLFVTNHHVVKNAGGAIRLVLNPGTAEQKVFTATVLRSDEKEDLVLLRVSDKAKLPTLELGSIDGLSELQTVYAFGFPFGKRLATTDTEYAAITVNTLSISSLRNKGRSLNRIQLDGSLNPGHSGGPVLDQTGRVVGMVVTGIRGAGLAEAIPVSLVQKFLAIPDVSLSYPTLTAKYQGLPATFEAKVASFMPGGKIDLELIVQAGSHRATAAMTRKEDTFSAQVVALPAVNPKAPRAATVYTDEATIHMRLYDRRFQAGPGTVSLGSVSQITLAGKGEVTLTDGTRIPGPITGLGFGLAKIAGESLKIDLSRVAKVAIHPHDVPGTVLCTVLVRVDGREVSRQEHSIRVEGVTSTAHAAAAAVPVTPAAPSLTANKVEVPLPSATDLFCVGGNGRYVILRLPRERKLAVFDSTAARVVKYLPLAEDNALIAAGQEKLYVGQPSSNAITRWNLGTFEKEVTAPLPPPKNGTFRHLVMGSASRGPLMVIAGDDARAATYFLDAASLKPITLKNTREGRPLWMPSSQLTRVSADGTTFTWWGTGSPSGFYVLTVVNDTATPSDTGTSCGHLTPSPDGKVIYTGRGAFTPQGAGLRGAGERRNDELYLVPALQGRYYLRVPTGEFPYRDRPRGPATLHIEGDARPLATLKDVEFPFEVNSWDREKVGADQRIMLVPSANLLILIPNTNDRLVLHRLDINAAIEASGIDYLLVTSSPVTAIRRGATYTYDIAVKSKKGGVKFKLNSGPEGMKVSGDGKLTWAVPAGYSDKTADVLLTISDSAGQEVFHSFKVAVTE